LNKPIQVNYVKRRNERKQHIISFEGTQYLVLKMGGFGVLRGLDSIIHAIDGENKGRKYYADISRGIDRIKSEVRQDHE